MPAAFEMSLHGVFPITIMSDSQKKQAGRQAGKQTRRYTDTQRGTDTQRDTCPRHQRKLLSCCALQSCSLYNCATNLSLYD